MRKFTWVVLTNCDDAHEDEFNAWYDEVHLHDLLRVPGIVAAGRCKVSPHQMTMGNDGGLVMCGPEALNMKYRYIAYYSIETDNISSVLEEVRSRSNTSEMVISPYLKEAYTVMCELPSAAVIAG